VVADLNQLKNIEIYVNKCVLIHLNKNTHLLLLTIQTNFKLKVIFVNAYFFISTKILTCYCVTNQTNFKLKISFVNLGNFFGIFY